MGNSGYFDSGLRSLLRMTEESCTPCTGVLCDSAFASGQTGDNQKEKRRKICALCRVNGQRNRYFLQRNNRVLALRNRFCYSNKQYYAKVWVIVSHGVDHSLCEQERLRKMAVKERVLTAEEVRQQEKKYWPLRRFQDILFSLLALLVLWPLMLVVALIIVIDSPGASPIFTQTRVGKNGREFKFYKFRSMCPNAEAKLAELLDKNEMEGPAFKIKDDPRITRVGKFIRATSIDELPQLINILKGDMSIVGPRPPLPREVEQYDETAWQRLMVTPGLTCYWQVQQYRNRLTFEQWVDLDVKYIKERSFTTDWKIIFKTFGAVFGMHGE